MSKRNFVNPWDDEWKAVLTPGAIGMTLLLLISAWVTFWTIASLFGA